MIITCPRCESSFNVDGNALGTTGRRVKCSKCSHLWHALPDTPPPEEEAPTPDTAQAAAAAGMDAPDDDSVSAALDRILSENAPEASADPAAKDSEDGEAEADGDADAAPDFGESDDAPFPAVDTDDADHTGDTDDQQAAEGESADSADGAESDGFPPPPSMLKEDREDNPLRRPPPRRRAGGIMAVSLVALVVLIAGIGVAGFVMQSKIVMWFPASSKLYAMVGLEPDILGMGLRIVEPKPTKRLEGDDEILVVEGQISNTSDKPISVPLMRGALLDENGKELHVWTFRAGKADALPGEPVIYKTEFRNPPPAAARLDITFTRSGASDLAEQPGKSPNPAIK